MLLIVVGTFLVYRLWFDFGPWVDLPHDDIPENSRQIDDLYAEAGQTALGAIRGHRDKHGFPAITAAVAVDQSVVWSGAVGLADVDGRIPATHATLMRIGSTSKAVTATALARLIDAGELSLDVPISKYSTNLPNEAWNPLTLRQLASHTAGLPDYERNGDRIGQLVTFCDRLQFDDRFFGLGIPEQFLCRFQHTVQSAGPGDPGDRRFRHWAGRRGRRGKYRRRRHDRWGL